MPLSRLVLSLACTSALNACVPSMPGATPSPVTEPVTVSRQLAYAHPLDDVRSAYRAVLEERGLRVEQEGAGGLRAVVGPDSSPGIVHVAFGPSDTLATRVTISHRYGATGDDFYHYPYQVPLLVARRLDRSLAIVSFHQGVRPASLTACPRIAVDTTAPIQEPRPVAGSGAMAYRTEYTEEARRRGIQGMVYLAGVVSDSGRVECVEILAGLPYGLTESAIRTLMMTRFTPAQQRGRPIPRLVILPVRFRIAED